MYSYWTTNKVRRLNLQWGLGIVLIVTAYLKCEITFL